MLSRGTHRNWYNIHTNKEMTFEVSIVWRDSTCPFDSRHLKIVPDSQNTLNSNVCYFSSSNMKTSVIPVWPKPYFYRLPSISRILGTRVCKKNSWFMIGFVRMYRDASNAHHCSRRLCEVSHTVWDVLRCFRMLTFIVNVLKSTHIFWHIHRFSCHSEYLHKHSFWKVWKNSGAFLGEYRNSWN